MVVQSCLWMGWSGSSAMASRSSLLGIEVADVRLVRPGIVSFASHRGD